MRKNEAHKEENNLSSSTDPERGAGGGVVVKRVECGRVRYEKLDMHSFVDWQLLVVAPLKDVCNGAVRSPALTTFLRISASLLR